MAKLHTRQERKLRMGPVKGRNRTARPKTFKTEEAAKKYAEAQGISKYQLEDLKAASSKKNKIRIITK